jgi:hypothetical protein
VVELSTNEEYAEKMRSFLMQLSNKLNVSLNWVIDIYYWLSDNVKAREFQLEDEANRPTRAEIIRIFDDGKGVVGVRLRFSSDSRRNEYYYTTVGKYGAKCTCERNMINGKVCKHIVAGLILMNVINVLKYGRVINLDEFRWLSEGGKGDLREDS